MHGRRSPERARSPTCEGPPIRRSPAMRNLQPPTRLIAAAAGVSIAARRQRHHSPGRLRRLRRVDGRRSIRVGDGFRESASSGAPSSGESATSGAPSSGESASSGAPSSGESHPLNQFFRRGPVPGGPGRHRLGGSNPPGLRGSGTAGGESDDTDRLHSTDATGQTVDGCHFRRVNRTRF